VNWVLNRYGIGKPVDTKSCYHSWEEVQIQFKRKVPSYEVPQRVSAVLAELMLSGYTIVTLKCSLCGEMETRNLFGNYKGDQRSAEAHINHEVERILRQYGGDGELRDAREDNPHGPQ